MSYTHTIHRQDENDDELVKAALRLGCVFEKFGPLEYWFFWTGLSTHWTPVEIKMAKRKGHADEFTPRQQKFIQRCQELNVKFEVWRTLDDVQDSRTLAFAKARAA